MGHTPLGALIMLLMILCMLALGITGFMMEEIDYFWGTQWVEDLHNWIANGLLAMIVLHIAAALFESYQMKENLPLSMIAGKKRIRE